MQRLLAIDVETASYDRWSVCQVGMARTDASGRIVTTSTLLNPQTTFLQPQMAVHGIRQADVRHAPTPAQWWPNLLRALRWVTAGNGTVLAHNMGFDLSAIRAMQQRWNLTPLPAFTYACTLQNAKKVWPGQPTYSLHALSVALGLDGFNHHDAEADAAASLRLGLAIMDAKRDVPLRTKQHAA